MGKSEVHGQGCHGVVGLTLEHVEIKGGCMVNEEALGGAVLKAYDV